MNAVTVVLILEPVTPESFIARSLSYTALTKQCKIIRLNSPKTNWVGLSACGVEL